MVVCVGGFALKAVAHKVAHFTVKLLATSARGDAEEGDTKPVVKKPGILMKVKIIIGQWAWRYRFCPSFART